MSLPTEEPTYYEQWGPIGRRLRPYLNFLSMLWSKEIVILLEIKWRLGDEIMAIPVYEAMAHFLKGRYKRNVRIVVWCNYPDLLDGNPYVDAVNVSDIRPHLYRNLRGAERNENRAIYYRDRIRIASADPAYVLTRPALHFDNWSTPLQDDIPGGDGPVVALCRGASWITKRWQEESWLALGRALEEKGYRVIVLGNDDEGIGVGTDFSGRTGMRDASCLLHQVDLTISSDSGLMHLSLAAGTKTIGLFGPTDSAILIADDDRFTPITNERDCQGCWNHDLSITEPGSCPKNIVGCMDVIEVERVLDVALVNFGEST